jgi:hypothetical protein
LNLDLVLGLAHLHAAADPIHRDRIAVAVQRDIPFDIDQPLMQPVDFRNPCRQRFQMQPLDREQLTRNRADMFLVSGVDLVAPLPRPLIQILPTAEGAPGQEVGLDEPEGPLHAPRTVRISNRVRHELKAEALSKGGHLRHWNHVASAAAQHDHMRVIDHDASCGATHVAQRVGEKDLAVEASERGITLEEQHPRIAQHRRCGLHPAFLASEFEIVGRGVMLHLLTRCKIILTRRRGRRISDAVPPAERC